jgi:hypothetical protein
MASISRALSAVGLLALGASHVARTYLEYSTAATRAAETAPAASPATDPEPAPTDGTALPTPLLEERLRAYREIMAAAIALNRQVVEMDPESLREAADLMAHGGDSSLDDAHTEFTQTYQSAFHVIDGDVREAVSDYADYLVTYHDEGAQVGELLSLSGGVAEAMRADLGLDSLFGDGAATSDGTATDDDAPTDE